MSKGSIGLGDELNAYLVEVGAREPEVLARLREETAVMPEAGMPLMPKLPLRMLPTQEIPALDPEKMSSARKT